MRPHALVIIAIFLALVLGGLLGRMIEVTAAPAAPTAAIAVREDRRALVPVVRLTGAEDGMLLGIAQGEVRVFVGDAVVVPNASGAFRVAARGLIQNLATPRVPAGMQFVASRRGRKYYPVTSRAGQNLAAENRIYFRTSAEAIASGFVE